MKRVAETNLSELGVKPPPGRGREDSGMGELSKSRGDSLVPVERGEAGDAPLLAEPLAKAPPGSKRPGRPAAPYLSWLGQSLRQSYEETLSEPVPESFAALLDRLEQDDEDKQT